MNNERSPRALGPGQRQFSATSLTTSRPFSTFMSTFSAFAAALLSQETITFLDVSSWSAGAQSTNSVMDAMLHIRGDEHIASLISQLDLDIMREWEGLRERHVAVQDKKRALAARFLKWRLKKEKAELEREEMELIAARDDWKQRARQRYGCNMKSVAQSKMELIQVQAQRWDARRRRQQQREQERQKKQQSDVSEERHDRDCQTDGEKAADRHVLALRQRDAVLRAEVMARRAVSKSIDSRFLTDSEWANYGL